MEFKGLNKNATRLLTGLILGTITLLCLKFGGLALLALLLVVVIYASKEFVTILQNKGFYPSFKIMVVVEVLLALVAYFQKFELVGVILTIGCISSFLWVLFKGRQPYIANVATTVLGFIYCGWFPLHLLFLRDLSSAQYHDGLGFVMMMFSAILLTDVGCLYFGTHFGKNKLAPVVSPNKTIEGSIGGVISAVIISLIFGYFLNVAWYLSLVAGFLCTACAQLGDLSESLMKRDAGVKDSGNTLPGHGGILDRTDSFVFTVPVMYYFCKLFIFENTITNQIAEFFKGLF